jgi:hypothetical protein
MFLEQLLQMEKGKIIGHDNPYLQTVKAITNIEAVLRRAGWLLEYW